MERLGGRVILSCLSLTASLPRPVLRPPTLPNSSFSTIKIVPPLTFASILCLFSPFSPDNYVLKNIAEKVKQRLLCCLSLSHFLCPHQRQMLLWICCVKFCSKIGFLRTMTPLFHPPDPLPQAQGSVSKSVMNERSGLSSLSWILIAASLPRGRLSCEGYKGHACPGGTSAKKEERKKCIRQHVLSAPWRHQLALSGFRGKTAVGPRGLTAEAGFNLGVKEKRS